MIHLKNKNAGISIIAVGLLISVMCFLFGALLITYLINSEWMSMDRLPILSLIIRVLAVTAGALFTCRKSAFKKMVAALIHAASCCVIIFLYVLLVRDGNFQNLILGVLTVFTSSFAACIVGINKRSGRKPVKYKVRNG